MRYFEDFRLSGGLAVHLWPTSKFRTVLLVVLLHSPLTDEAATFLNLLPAVLTRGTRQFPETRLLNKRLDLLYGASITSSFLRCGERGLVSISATMPDIESEGKHPLGHLCDVVSSVLFDPPLTGSGLLRSDFIAQERAGILNDIASFKDDKDAWAEYRCMANMGRDEAFSVHPYGDEDLLRSIGPEPLTSWWKDVLPELPADIFAIGNFDVVEAMKLVSDAFSGRIRGGSDPGPAATYKDAPEKPVYVQEMADTVQAKLVMGWRFKSNWASADYPAHVIANNIFGQYPQSKLFTNIREKQGLAYSVGSKIEPTKGLVFAMAGIDAANAKKAAEIAIAQHKALSEGDITEKELAESKKSIEMGLRMALDNPTTLYAREMTGIVNGKTLTIDEAVSAIRACTTQEVARAASSWKLDTVFTLVPSSNPEGGNN